MAHQSKKPARQSVGRTDSRAEYSERGRLSQKSRRNICITVRCGRKQEISSLEAFLEVIAAKGPSEMSVTVERLL